MWRRRFFLSLFQFSTKINQITEKTFFFWSSFKTPTIYIGCGPLLRKIKPMRASLFKKFGHPSAVATGGPKGGACPLMTACAPPFRFTQNTFLEHLIRQQTIMEQGIITFKVNSRLKYFRLLAKLLATNCCT